MGKPEKSSMVGEDDRVKTLSLSCDHQLVLGEYHEDCRQKFARNAERHAGRFTDIAPTPAETSRCQKDRGARSG